jgi:glycosyltransferase involved in cell wall biosynthesis
VKVGVDAQHLSYDKCGVGCYIKELSRALLETGIDLKLYTPQGLLHQELGDLVRERVKSGRFLRGIWAQTALPFSAIRDDIDVFWGAAHRLPVFLPSKIAKVVTIHDFVWKLAGQTMRGSGRVAERLFVRQTISAADVIMAASQKTADDIVTFYPAAANKTRVVYLGKKKFHDEWPESVLLSLGIKRDFILFVGTLEPRKNLNRLLAAYSRLPAHVRQEVQMVVAGSYGWGGIDLQSQIVELGLIGEVIVLGSVDEKLLATLYRHSLFQAMPSIYEGFGLPVVEAMSFSKAVLVGGGSLPEVAGSAGVCVDPYDELSIRNGLIKLLDPRIRSEMEKRAFVRAQDFDWKRSAELVVGVYHEALERSYARRRTTRF